MQQIKIKDALKMKTAEREKKEEIVFCWDSFQISLTQLTKIRFNFSWSDF